MKIKAVLFDLDGVIVSTDEQHYLGWKRLADELGLPFDRERNDLCRGTSRMEGLLTVLGERSADYNEAEKAALADRKNGYYRELLTTLSPADILPGVVETLDRLDASGVAYAIGSSSRNAPGVLERIGLTERFPVVIDGNCVTHSKPHPEVFLKGAEALGIEPAQCLVVEDAESGVSAALAAGMQCLAVGAAASDPRAHYQAPDLAAVDWSRAMDLSNAL